VRVRLHFTMPSSSHRPRSRSRSRSRDRRDRRDRSSERRDSDRYHESSRDSKRYNKREEHAYERRDDRNRKDSGGQRHHQNHQVNHNNNGRNDSSYSSSNGHRYGDKQGSSNEKPKEKPKSGIFQYLSGILPPAAQVPTKTDEEKTTDPTATASSLSVNANALKRVIEGDQRSGDRYDRNRLENASKLLSKVSGGSTSTAIPTASTSTSTEPLHLKTVSSVTLNGSTVKDGYSQGLKPDIAAMKQLPYVCDICQLNMLKKKRNEEADDASLLLPSADIHVFSFLTATQLSDHLKRIHNENRHASLIKPSKQKKISEMLADENDEEENGY
jgi:hypothetical protein